MYVTYTALNVCRYLATARFLDESHPDRHSVRGQAAAMRRVFAPVGGLIYQGEFRPANESFEHLAATAKLLPASWIAVDVAGLQSGVT